MVARVCQFPQKSWRTRNLLLYGSHMYSCVELLNIPNRGVLTSNHESQRPTNNVGLRDWVFPSRKYNFSRRSLSFDCPFSDSNALSYAFVRPALWSTSINTLLLMVSFVRILRRRTQEWQETNEPSPFRQCCGHRGVCPEAIGCITKSVGVPHTGNEGRHWQDHNNATQYNATQLVGNH